jgi:DNA-binding MarR family transcriptional regulator
VSREHRDELIHRLTDQFRAYQTATDELDELAQRVMGINRSDARCLDILDRGGQMTAGRLAEESGLSTGAVTAVIDRLERAGLARRVRDESDRRKVLVEVTDEADRLAGEIYGPMAEHGRRMLAEFDEDQLEVFIRLMRGAREITVQNTTALRERLEREGAPRARRSGARAAG